MRKHITKIADEKVNNVGVRIEKKSPIRFSAINRICNQNLKIRANKLPKLRWTIVEMNINSLAVSIYCFSVGR